MDPILQALGGILLRAVPTLLLVLFLQAFLKRVFFGPLEDTLRQRHAATIGSQEAARTSLERAQRRLQEYEDALRGARTEVFRHQEDQRAGLRREQESRLEEARLQAEHHIRVAEEQLTAESAQVRKQLLPQVERLADDIVNRVLAGGRA